MATTFTMPSLGDTPEVPIVTRWLKAVGDFVEVDEPLVEVSTSKVDTELPSPVQGFVKKILAQEDESVAVGGALALIGAADEAFEGFRRSESKVMIAPATNITDEGRYESPDGTRSFAIPRYAIHTEKVGGVEEPRVLIVERAGVSFLSITLAKDPGPASGPGVEELPHTIRVTLAMETPSPTEFELSVASPTDGGTLFAAELPLEVGQREQFVAAFGDIQANVMLVLERKITVAQDTGQHFEDGQEAYVEREVELTGALPPMPFLLSDRQRARLSGGIAEQTRKVRLDFEGHTHTYWQDANEPAQFAYLPDEFLLARSAEVPLKSQLRAAVHTGGEAPKFVLEFTAQPVTSARRLAAARKALAAKAQELGANEPVTLQPLDDAQPILRLALPVDGVASPKLVAREATRLDMQSGLRHSEVFELEDFRAVFGALNGQSLTLLGGEILVRAGTPDEAEVPLELRLDRAGGEVLKVQAQPLAQPATQVTVTNGIESPVLLDDLHAVAIGANTQLPLAIDQLPAGSRLAPGESCDVRLTFPSAATDPDLSLLVDQIDVVVEPDEKAIWELIFDQHTEERLVRDIQIHALAAMFKDPARPDDEVLEFIVTIENGSSTIIDPSTLDVTTKVRVPVIPLLTGDGSPTFRYRTETHWSSGAIGTSDWREVDSTIIIPVRAAS